MAAPGTEDEEEEVVDLLNWLAAVYLWVFPIGFLVSVLLHLFFWIFTPRPAKVISRARWKRGGVIVVAVDDAGMAHFKYMKPSVSEGVLKGNPESYMFIPSPLPVGGKKGDKGKGKEDKAKMAYNELVKKRCIVEGLNKPIYFGSVSKGVAVSPQMLEALQEASENRRVKLLSLDKLREFLEVDFGPQKIEDLGALYYLRGKLGRRRTAVTVAVPIVLLLVVILVAWLLMSGKIQLPGAV